MLNCLVSFIQIDFFFWNSSITNYLNVYIVSLQFTFLTASLTISALFVMSTDVEKTF